LALGLRAGLRRQEERGGGSVTRSDRNFLWLMTALCAFFAMNIAGHDAAAAYILLSGFFATMATWVGTEAT
jgi:hypothetical protein